MEIDAPPPPLLDGEESSINAQMELALLAPSTPGEEAMECSAIDQPMEAGRAAVAAALPDLGPGTNSAAVASAEGRRWDWPE